MRLLTYFEEENPHRILIPRGRLCLFWLLMLLLESAVCLLWKGVFILVALPLSALTVYLLVFGLRLWRRYYALVWYPVCLFFVSGGAVALRLLVYRLFAV